MADRRKIGTKDMVMTMAVVLVVVALIALYGSQVSFAPGAQPSDGPVRTVQVVDGFGHAATTMGFSVTVPRDVPESWIGNSFTVSDPGVHNDGVTQVGSLPAVRGGWLTGKDQFVQLIESPGSPDRLLKSEFGSARDSEGTVTAGGATWTVTTGVRDEAAWFRTAGATTMLITGNAPQQDFVTLAEALAAS